MATHRPYGWIASIYDRLADIYSGGAIERCKQRFLGAIPANQRILVVGAGRGRDAAAAHAAGHRVTVLERDKAMLEVLVSTMPNGVNIVDVDLRAFQSAEHFDIVVANFFLNVEASGEALEHIAAMQSHLRSGGHLVVGDFAPEIGGTLPRRLQHLYFTVPLWFFHRFTGNAWHGLTDYGALLKQCGLAVRPPIYTRIFRRGPRWLATWIATKIAP